MRYYLIAGEASGDLHAAQLIHNLRSLDPEAEVRAIGGDNMHQAGATLLRHYRDIAFMGFVPVLMHLGTILRAEKECRRDVEAFEPDHIILVDYAGFNLRIAAWARRHTRARVTYYILPKLWAWKEGRARRLRETCHQLLSILPFEVEYFQRRHSMTVHYVGNPTAQEVGEYLREHGEEQERRPGTLALLPGSRRQEISLNLPIMLAAAEGREVIIAGAPGIEPAFYERYAQGTRVVYGDTYGLLLHSEVALVTSGTATLECALLGTPQVVCYAHRLGRLANWGKRWLLKVKYISLVNLILGKEAVAELVGAEMNAPRLRRELEAVLPHGKRSEALRVAYSRLAETLASADGEQSAAQRVWSLMLS